MLEMKPSCESCAAGLSQNAQDAYICSYECTFCRECATDKFDYVCPNCSGALVLRPARKIDGV